MRQVTLSQRLFLVAVVAAIPSLLVPLVILWSVQGQGMQKLHADAGTQSQIAALEAELVVDTVANVLRTLRTAPVVLRGDGPGCSDFARSVAQSLLQVAQIAVLDANGTAVCSSAPMIGKDAMPGLETLAPIVGRQGIDTGTFQPAQGDIPASLPVSVAYEGPGTWQGGTIVGWLNLDWLGQQIATRARPEGGSITIADRDGTILARQPRPEDFVGTVIPDAFQRLVRASAPGTEAVTSQDGTRRVIGYSPVATGGSGLYVSVGLPIEPQFWSTVRSISGGLALSMLGSLAALGTAWLTSDRVIRTPFARLTSTVAAWQRGDMQARIGMDDRRDDFGDLGRALDQFIDQLMKARAERQTAEAQRETLTRELDHRIKNLFATVQAIARQSLRGKGRDDAVEDFLGRLAAMSTAHELLIDDRWQTASLAAVVRKGTRPFDDGTRSRIDVSGPELTVNSRTAMAVAMALHELCTNAVKYGALHEPSGRVSIRWHVDGDDLHFVWRETDGPPVTPPQGRGFGSTMIEQVLAQQVGGEVTQTFHPDGLECHLTVPTRNVAPDHAA